MQRIDIQKLQHALDRWAGRRAFIHLETTRGAYTEGTYGAFARNVEINIEYATIAGSGPYRLGIKTTHGWVFAEGLTDWLAAGDERLECAGLDDKGRITVAVTLSAERLPL